MKMGKIARQKTIYPEEIDLALIPCLTCNEQGARLGYGGGYYDRYLEQTACTRAALCRELFLTDDIPVEEHDQQMDLIVTETGVTHVKNSQK